MAAPGGLGPRPVGALALVVGGPRRDFGYAAPVIALARRSGLIAIATVALGACMGPVPATLPQLQTRAALDLNCPPSMLQLYHIGARTKGVAGCNRHLVYVESCQGERECAWVLDNPPAGGGWVTAPAQPTTAFAPAPPAPLTAEPATPPPWTPPPAASSSGLRPPDFGF